jgi:hypothetical protein
MISVVDDFAQKRVFAPDALGVLSGAVRCRHKSRDVDRSGTLQLFRDRLQLGKPVVKVSY